MSRRGGAAQDAEGEALLEWLASVKPEGDSGGRELEDLSDGEALLHVLHDLSAEAFPSPDASGGRDPTCLLQLLESLESHFQDRGAASHASCRQLLEEARAVDRVDVALLTKLVLVATVENDFPRRSFYVDIIMDLSSETQEVVHEILQRFINGAANESPVSTSSRKRFASHAEVASEAAFSPPSRHLSSKYGSPGQGLPDFMEMGIDLDTRFRRLQDLYHDLLETHERVQDECASLRYDLDVQTSRRKNAEESERHLRRDLREAEEDRDRAREEQRFALDQRMQQDAGHVQNLLAQREEELETLREELSLARGQAAIADRLSHQLDICKQKLEQQQAWRSENEDLKAQIDSLLKRQGAGGADHLHRSLTRAREDLAVANRERDESQRQCELLRQEASREQQVRRKLSEELNQLRQGSTGLAGSGGSAGVAGAQPLSADGRGVLNLKRDDAQAATEPPANEIQGPPAPAEKAVTQHGGGDLLERLLAEKERATRAETTLQAKTAEAAELAKEAKALTARVAVLEAQAEASKAQAQAAAATAAPAPAPAPPAPLPAPVQILEDQGKVQELQNQLALRERELQVHQWRGKSEHEAVMAQETLMVSCFHELGLRYQRLRAENDLLKRQLRSK